MIAVARLGSFTKSTCDCWMIGTSFLKQSVYFAKLSGVAASDCAYAVQPASWMSW